jgi:hypothetical protein
MMQNNYKELLLILDQAPPHIEKSFQRALNEANIRTRMIPKRMTSILQMADVCWFAVMKKYFLILSYNKNKNQDFLKKN